MSEVNGWWYFKRHRIFESWGIFGNTSMPKIAIIDSGFDTSSSNLDKPNYIGGYSIMPNGSGTTMTIGDIQPNPSETSYSHGSMVASIAGSPKNNNYGFCGILPDINILPIKVPIGSSGSNSCIVEAIKQASSDASVDVINISIGAKPNTTSNILVPITIDPIIKTEIINATNAISPKIIVITAGNDSSNLNSYNIQSLPGVIVVGGSDNSSSYTRSIAWSGSNYGNIVDLTAASNKMVTYSYAPNTNYRQYASNNGTSLAAPIISVAASMVKSIAVSNGFSLTPEEVKNILIGSSNIGTYDSSGTPQSKYLGFNLGIGSTASLPNINKRSSIRDLNLFNALTIAKNIGSYNTITRVFNSDDYIQATSNSNWVSAYAYEGYKNDAIYGLNNITNETLNFRTKNAAIGGYTYGYQVYKNKKLYKEVFDGIAGVIGASANVNGVYTNSNIPAGWLSTYNF